ncbi:MAG: UDP-N-acetylmuramoylalanyl-D-glutamyl-2,6-diaminopimelate--D-alanyl-D-alanine ligase [Rhizobiales bacterium]|nr:UDP-N-acetylmuramoylalanyl-D-glutamyl-2,6-diaminopimelate--D-alanyl-D-alanine ligase [Hyphomicrobiales bacterium]MBO6697642.1 UDP-N-acetylmuramoylalanyl-D-glutamyl-2,6-diaminopimelate--D-alanyl-D-alanine ligase [Hyphomicrobiales bacterium]MBO6736103.1 UDP-N-acetylmuramoylalanyl-D-glutamyl-2,6-diaminopimelate--D-alanyl-D-alanine ligase [Hyphomicrobiales bacterium]MBO6912573.1 UDP-N-acetylmuramoylalanyl-D-glutamyl-2,6-diaminopimelate--D-alanyl-D-alanine ligase [Hyphomicrobiales bacterium]MBO69
MGTPLWTIDEVLAAAHGSVRGEPGDVFGVSIDSRTVAPGDLFIAIKGDQFDGHAFVDAALEAGATAALVSSDQADSLAVPKGGLIIVPDSYDGLYDLARAARARATGKMLAITGSVGKTSTKETFRLILSSFGVTHAPVKSFNNHWGVPLTLCRMPRDTEFGVFEIGMNNAGEITPLSKLVQPHIAMITTVAPVHLENLGSLDAIAAAKAEIFDGLLPGGTAVVHGDIEHTPFLKDRASKAGAGRVMTFGHGASNDAELMQVALHADCSTVEAKIGGQTIAYKVGAPGEHLVINSLGVLAICSALELDLAKAGLALANMEQPDGRGRKHIIDTPGDAITLLDESYNANPASVKAALKVLSRLPTGQRGRRIAVLGDMLELGDNAAAMHGALVYDLTALGVDKVYACGPLMKALWRVLPMEKRGAYAETSQGLQKPLVADLAPGDAVMIKGSLGSKMGPLVDLILQRYKDR